jgi:hypothetical protein
MSLEDLSVLKNWLLTRIETVGAEEKVNGAARVKQLQEQLRDVEAEIALKEKPQ